ncbi:alkaline phosphatase [Palleronia marisminoris]|uniref:Alkaline phosphatase n=1 Tax=Palleronia marisminoris TaxID=315423 RepID=A0A1Y5RWZ0_9RHOB|nr:alkaline phosphatase [Palleronia marisminoris]SFG51127.1 alkaline phosphatase [Palleronia marisminoris]SLN24450.1 Alkaline phosphatase precursor [Palleronia marisminoris]
MKFSLSVTMAVLLGSTAAFAQTADLPQQGNEWFTSAQETLQQLVERQENTNRALNVILFVADGNGVGTNYATRLFEGQQQGGLGDDHNLPQDEFPYSALVKTYSANGQTPDSAPTATAMNSGIKTKNDLINVTDNVAVGDCAAGLENGVRTFAEIVSDMDKSVGVISTARITHATPAAVYARTADRDFEDDTLIPEGCEQDDIALQLYQQMENGVIDLAMGGGRRHFITTDTTDAEDSAGVREDSQNLAQMAVDNLSASYVQTQEEFDALDLTAEGPILGLFEPSHMQYEADRSGEPSLAEMTTAAIEKLSQNDNGYYLEVEAGRVDHANHAGNAARVLTDGVAFAEAIRVADEMTDDADTLIIVTSDHEHAIAFNGYCGRGSDILGLCMQVNGDGIEALDEPNMASDALPYTVIGYLNGAGSVLVEQIPDEAETSAATDVDTGEASPEAGAPIYSGDRSAIADADVTDIDYLQQALIPMSSETHSGEDVAVYAKGPWAHLFDGTIEQNVIFHVMHHAATAGEATSN